MEITDEGMSLGVLKKKNRNVIPINPANMGVTQTMADLDACPQLNARQMFLETGDTLGGMFRGVKTPARLTACIDSPTEPPPKLGEHNRELLCTLGGMTPEELAALEVEGAL